MVRVDYLIRYAHTDAIFESATRFAMGNIRFNAPPGWPEPPEGWRPTHDWQPDPSWPPAPEGWAFWRDSAQGAPAAGEFAPGRSGPRQNPKPGSAKPTSKSKYQRRWMAAYLTVVVLNVVFLLLAITGSEVPAEALFAVWLGTLASIAGVLMGADLMRRRVGDSDFDDATKAMRVMAIAWVLLAVSLIVTVVVGTGGGNTADVSPEAERALLGISDAVVTQVFGAVVFFLIVGDEYTKYRRLVSASKPVS